jgi:hypothetical protein
MRNERKKQKAAAFLQQPVKYLISVNTALLSVSAFSFELNLSVNKSKKRIVASYSDVVAGMDLCASLSYKDIARKYKLTVGALCTQSFRFAVTTVFCTSHTFFMSHLITPLNRKKSA